MVHCTNCKSALPMAHTRHCPPPPPRPLPEVCRPALKSSLLVAQSLMWARLAQHQPEEAIEPYAVCVTLRRSAKDLSGSSGSPPIAVRFPDGPEP